MLFNNEPIQETIKPNNARSTFYLCQEHLEHIIKDDIVLSESTNPDILQDYFRIIEEMRLSFLSLSNDFKNFLTISNAEFKNIHERITHWSIDMGIIDTSINVFDSAFLKTKTDEIKECWINMSVNVVREQISNKMYFDLINGLLLGFTRPISDEDMVEDFINRITLRTTHSPKVNYELMVDYFLEEKELDRNKKVENEISLALYDFKHAFASVYNSGDENKIAYISMYFEVVRKIYFMLIRVYAYYTDYVKREIHDYLNCARFL